jgi:hypothetical protein
MALGPVPPRKPSSTSVLVHCYRKRLTANPCVLEIAAARFFSPPLKKFNISMIRRP